MRQRAISEAIGNALLVHVLLRKAAHHLADVHDLALGSRLDHINHAVLAILGDAIPRNAIDALRVVQNAHDLALKEVMVVEDTLILQITRARAGDKLDRLGLHALDGLAHILHDLRRKHKVADAAAEARREEPTAHQARGVIEEAARLERPVIVKDHRNDTTRLCRKD